MNPSTKKLHLHDFSSRLTAALEEAGATQLALARRLKVDQASVSRWMSRKSEPFPKMLPEIALALGVEAEWLLSGKGQRYSQESLRVGEPVVRLTPLEVGMHLQPSAEITFGTRLLRWRERMKFTPESAAQHLGCALSKYREMEAGRRPSDAFERKFESVEHESPSVIAEHGAEKYERMREQRREGNGISNRPAGDGRAMMMRVVPVLGWAKAGEAVEFEDVVDWDERVSLPVNDAKAFGIRVKGDSMSPRICEGDIVVVSPSESPRNEKPVVVRLRDQGILLKQFHRLTATTFELRSLNPFYLPVTAAMTDVVWIYPVIATINYP